MWQTIILVVLMILTFSSPVHCKTFNVRSVEHSGNQAVLVDRDTGVELLASEGDSFEDWTVHEIGPAHVTFIHRIHEHRAEIVTVPAESTVEDARSVR
ncbi:hypothetical protein [Desulforhabdus sp. TSK]|uniref:hypothetical protein n=1 Tax=Desulforhabdus sp. TSK TaxID=2925014 RepID=UPI001FC819F8|nr:hypothetical protein [Desulforhabdus sp. TSK]GKT10907.1 hypothetical protein DSTSK_42120 [Desulforhabdus sp. TSK]